jgi:hypothetical protein
MTDKKLPVISRDGDLKEAQKTAERFVAIYKDHKLDLPIVKGKTLADAELDKWIDDSDDKAAVSDVGRGIGYLLKKKQVGNKVFWAWVEQTGRSYKYTQRLMKVAEMVHGLSVENGTRVSHFPIGKQIALTSAPSVMLDDLLDNDEITEEMTREQMSEIIRLQKKVKKLEEKLDTSEQEKRFAQHKAANKRIEARFPEYVEVTRDESVALCAEIEIRLEKLERLYHTLEDQRGYVKKDQEAQRFLRIAESGLYHNLNGLIGRATPVLLAMREQYDASVTGPILDNDVLFTPEQATAAMKERSFLLQEQSAAELLRHTRREESKQKGRGRPKKNAGTK